VLREVGVNPEGLRPKSVSEFLARVPVRYGITLGQRGEPHAPRIYPFAALPLNDVATAPPTPAPQPPTKEGLLAAYLSGCVKRPDATIRTCNCEVAHLQAYSLNQMLAFLDAHDDRPLDAVKVMCAYETRNAF